MPPEGHAAGHHARAVARTHWTRERVLLVDASGSSCFYVIYVSYLYLKSFLLLGYATWMYDRELHMLDSRALFFGHEPRPVIHDLLGEDSWSRTFSSLPAVYLMVPLAVTAWLVWSRNMSYG